MHEGRILQKQCCTISLLARKGTQVSKLSGKRIAKILADYEITRLLASEAGRTSRGSVDNMIVYVNFLNELNLEGNVDLAAIEGWWIDRVRDHFASMPLTLEFDTSLSVESIIRRLLGQVERRQQESLGSTYVGTVLQHLVGAKLELLLEGSGLAVKHFGASVADGPTSRPGDFTIGDTVIHVTTAPTDTLVQKCMGNINAGLKPVIVTLLSKLSMARGNAESRKIDERIEILAIEQFLTSNVYEHSLFQRARQQHTIEQLIGHYNRIIDTAESDPSLRIQIGGS